MEANLFVLRHRDVEIVYDTGVTPAVLTYRDGSVQDEFSGTVQVENTGLGSLVSVSLNNGGGSAQAERFGFFLPDVNPGPGQTTPINTTGVYYKEAEAFGKPASWHSIELSGLAEGVIQPLTSS